MERHLDASEGAVVRHEAATDRQETTLDQYTRELNLRQDKIVRELFDQLRELMAAQTKALEELGEEVRAMKMALLAVLDRLSPPGDAA
jgi:hypothetical protein